MKNKEMREIQSERKVEGLRGRNKEMKNYIRKQCLCVCVCVRQRQRQRDRESKYTISDSKKKKKASEI